MPYIITEKTLALLPIDKKTRVLEWEKDFIIEEKIIQIIEHNCILNGSTLEGRRKGSSYLIGASYKPPIIIDEMKRIILVPTLSNKNPNCKWFVLDNILKYYINSSNRVVIMFKNDQKLELDLCYTNFDKQVLRATRLESSLRSRKYK